MALEVGSKAPDFSLATDDADETVSLRALKGKTVLLYFYPRDDTPGCTVEACSFRDEYKQFKKLGIEIFGISRDSSERHAKFRAKYQLPFTLLVDEEGEVCKAYGVLQKKTSFGKTSIGIVRSTFLIDPTGKISHIWRNVKASDHVENILNELN